MNERTDTAAGSSIPGDVHLLSGAYAVGALEGAELVAFETHLASCPDCRDEVDGLIETATILGSAAQQAPPSSLRASTMARISAVRQLPPAPREEVAPDPEPFAAPTIAASSDAATGGTATWDSAGPKSPTAGSTDDAGDGVVVALRSRRRPVTWVLGVAASILAIAAVGLGLNNMALNQRVDSIAASAADVTRVLTAPDARSVSGEVSGGGRAAIVTSDSVDAAVFVGENLPSPGDNRTYQLWALTPEGARSAGTFDPDSDGPTAVTLPADALSAAGIGLTIEPAGGSAQPTTSVIMRVDLTA